MGFPKEKKFFCNTAIILVLFQMNICQPSLLYESLLVRNFQSSERIVFNMIISIKFKLASPHTSKIRIKSQEIMKFSNPLLVNVPTLYPLRTPENLWFCGVFRGYKMGPLARNGLKISSYFHAHQRFRLFLPGWKAWTMKHSFFSSFS